MLWCHSDLLDINCDIFIFSILLEVCLKFCLNQHILELWLNMYLIRDTDRDLWPQKIQSVCPLVCVDIWRNLSRCSWDIMSTRLPHTYVLTAQKQNASSQSWHNKQTLKRITKIRPSILSCRARTITKEELCTKRRVTEEGMHWIHQWWPCFVQVVLLLVPTKQIEMAPSWFTGLTSCPCVVMCLVADRTAYKCL